MTETQALQSYFSQFGLPAYPKTAVPSKLTFPYLTYEVMTASWGMPAVNIAVNLWYHTDSEKEPNEKAKEIVDQIGLAGKTIKCDDGIIWIKKGSPWCISLADDTDQTFKQRQLNVTLEFFTY